MSLPDDSNPEVPEGDALEQEREVEPGPTDLPLTDDPEVSEGDALDQAREVPTPEPE